MSDILFFIVVQPVPAKCVSEAKLNGLETLCVTDNSVSHWVNVRQGHVENPKLIGIVRFIIAVSSYKFPLLPLQLRFNFKFQFTLSTHFVPSVCLDSDVMTPVACRSIMQAGDLSTQFFLLSRLHGILSLILYGTCVVVVNICGCN
jgi:hypothetical protein